MDDQILAIYCLCDDMLKALDHQNDPQCQMSDAEVLTTAIVAGLHFAGNLERARQCLKAPRYIPSKRRYFYGLKIFLLTTAEGEPVELFLTPGTEADVSALPTFDFDLPPGSTGYGDKAFNLYDVEDLMQDAGIHLLLARKRNSTRAVPPYVAYLQHCGRKMVETAGSLISRLLPKSIHAVTPQGFELKVIAFVLAHSVSLAIQGAT